MELVCSEVGKKIRSAIRVRLLELGKTVDDELIDYIMVMAANKKEESQMARDLLPFLEEDTIKFTSWLQKVLKKLEQAMLVQIEARQLPARTDSMHGSRDTI